MFICPCYGILFEKVDLDCPLFRISSVHFCWRTLTIAAVVQDWFRRKRRNTSAAPRNTRKVKHLNYQVSMKGPT